MSEPPRPPRPPDTAYEADPEAEPPRPGPPPWWVQREHGTPEFERVLNRQRAETWRSGGGGNAPVYLRADVAQALAERAFGGPWPVEEVSLDDVADWLLAEALGIERGLPTAAPPPEGEPQDDGLAADAGSTDEPTPGGVGEDDAPPSP